MDHRQPTSLAITNKDSAYFLLAAVITTCHLGRPFLIPMGCSALRGALTVIWGCTQNSLIHQTFSCQSTGENTT